MTDPTFINKVLETCNTRSPAEILKGDVEDTRIEDGFGNLEDKTSDIISGAISFCLEASAESLGDLLLMARRPPSSGTHARTTDRWLGDVVSGGPGQSQTNAAASSTKESLVPLACGAF